MGIKFAANFIEASHQRLSKGDNADLSVSGNVDFTLAAWVRPTGLATYNTIAGKWNESGSIKEYVLNWNPTWTQWNLFVSSNGSSAARVTSEEDMVENGWHFIVGWHDATADKTYIQVNNSGVVSAAHAGGIFDGANEFSIGGYSAPTSLHSWNGQIAAVGLWKRVLTSGERTSLFNSGDGKVYAELASGEKTSLVSFWNLDTVSWLDSHGSNDLTDVSSTGSVSITDGPGPFSTANASCDLFMAAPLSINDSHNLYIAGPLQITGSGNLYISGPPQIVVFGDLYTEGHESFTASSNLFMSSPEQITTLEGPSKIYAWGRNSYGEIDVPAPNTDFIAVAGGNKYSLALRANGSIVAWGLNINGQCDVPAPNTDFQEVAAGGAHSLGLKVDGSIVAWGLNSEGQTNVPAPNSNFVAVAAGGWHSLGLKADGSIEAWGWNDFGQCNVPAPNSDFVAIAAGYAHSLGLKADGSIVAWGNNTYGQINVPSPNTNFMAVAGGSYHNLGLKVDGSIVAWGRNTDGQLNIPAPNTDFVSFAGGIGHSLGLKTNSSIVAWGNNDYGQCDVPTPNTNFVVVAAGYYHSMGIKILDISPYLFTEGMLSSTASGNLYLQAPTSATGSVSLYLKTHMTEQGSGYLQPDSVIFYHPLDDPEEMTQDQLWQGEASFVTGKIGSAGASAIAAATFDFAPGQSGYIQSTGDTDSVFGFLNEQKFVVAGISEFWFRVCDISDTTFVWGPESTGAAFTKPNFPVILPLSWDTVAETGYFANLSRAFATNVELRLYQVSGTTITAKASITFNGDNGPVYDTYSAITNMDVSGSVPTGHMLLTADSEAMQACIITVSGDTLASGITYSGASTGECLSLIRINDTKAAVLYSEGGIGEDKAYILTADYSSDLITWSSGHAIDVDLGSPHPSNYLWHSRLVHVSGDTFMGLWSDPQAAGRAGWVQACEVSDTSIIFGELVQFALGGPDNWSTDYILGTKLTNNSVYIDYRHEKLSPSAKYHKYCIATIDGLSVSVGNEYIRKTVDGDLWGGFAQAISPSAVVAHQVWGNATPPDYWAYGTPTFDFNLQATDGSAYPTISGITRITTAMWSKNLTTQDTVITIERGYQIQITPSSIVLGSDSVTWDDSGISGVLSDINDGTERFLVLDFEYQGSDNWKLYTSIDGSGWVDQGVQNTGTLTPLTVDTAPSVSGVDVLDSEWIDELILWGGLTDQFTNTELSNLHELADTYGDTMGLYANHWGSLTANATLFLDATPEISSGIALHISSHKTVSGEANLCIPSPIVPINASSDSYIQGDLRESGSSSLFISPFASLSASSDLFTTSYQSQSRSAQLFTFAPPPDLYRTKSLFIRGHQAISASGDLFIQGHGFSTASGDLYLRGYQSSSGSAPLFTFAPPPDLYNTESLYIASSEFFVDQRLYFGERGIEKVRRSNLDGSSIQDIAVNTFGAPMDISYNPLDKKLYLSTGWGLPSAIERMTLDGKEREWLYTSDSVLAWGIALNPGAGKIYWMDNAGGNLYRANIDIPDGETSGTRTDTEVLVSGLDGPAYVAIDITNSQLYFTERGTVDKISRCDLDGSGVEGLVSGSMSMLADIVLDVPNNTMYWCDVNNPTIEKANLDGSNREVIVTAGDGLDEPRGLAIDLITRKLYWTEYTNGNLKRSNLDGSNIQTILAGLSLPIAVDIFPHVTTFYTQGHGSVNTNASLFIGSGAVAASGNPLDWLIHTHDYNPQLIGTFTQSSVSVNIQLWDITNGVNDLVILTSSGCYEIGDTNRWGWSTANLPINDYSRHYFYRMISDTSEVFDGQFLLDIPERGKWIYPNDQSEYLV